MSQPLPALKIKIFIQSSSCYFTAPLDNFRKIRRPSACGMSCCYRIESHDDRTTYMHTYIHASVCPYRYMHTCMCIFSAYIYIYIHEDPKLRNKKRHGSRVEIGETQRWRPIKKKRFPYAPAGAQARSDRDSRLILSPYSKS